MTRCYALGDPAPRDAAPSGARPPTYPDRPLAFRWYPTGWWVCHPGHRISGRVSGESSTRTVHLILPSGERCTFDRDELVSCTARQVAALESGSPTAAIRASVIT